jgi:hypothetical protein
MLAADYVLFPLDEWRKEQIDDFPRNYHGQVQQEFMIFGLLTQKS